MVRGASLLFVLGLVSLSTNDHRKDGGTFEEQGSSMILVKDCAMYKNQLYQNTNADGLPSTSLYVCPI